MPQQPAPAPRHARQADADDALLDALGLRRRRGGLARRAEQFTRELAIATACLALIGVGAVDAGLGAVESDRRLVTAASSGLVPPPFLGGRKHVVAAPHDRDTAVAVAAAPAAPKTAATHAARAKAPASVAAATGKRWLPTGTGMWLHDWDRSEGGDADRVVARAQKLGLTHLYVQTGSTKKRYIGTEVLSELLPATKGTGISVIAWDFPKLVVPTQDAMRLVRAAKYQRPGMPRVAAVAPDVETGSEGTRLSPRAVEVYYRTLRKHLPKEIAILATVPWPSEHRVNMYPYDRTARYTDAWIPMAYWYNRSPSKVTTSSMRFFQRRYGHGKPVMPVGQGYDGRLDAPYLAPDRNPGASVQAFLSTAKRYGAPSVSLWSWQTMQPQAWTVLGRARHSFGGSLPDVPHPSPLTVPAQQRGAVGSSTAVEAAGS